MKHTYTLLLSVFLIVLGNTTLNAQTYWEINECIRGRPFPILIDSSFNDYSFTVDTMEGYGVESGILTGSNTYIKITHRGCEYYYLQLMICSMEEGQVASVNRTNDQITQFVIDEVCRTSAHSKFTFKYLCESISKHRSETLYPNVEVDLSTNVGMNEVFLINDCKLVDQHWCYYFEYSMGPL